MGLKTYALYNPVLFTYDFFCTLLNDKLNSSNILKMGHYIMVLTYNFPLTALTWFSSFHSVIYRLKRCISKNLLYTFFCTAIKSDLHARNRNSKGGDKHNFNIGSTNLYCIFMLAKEHKPKMCQTE